MIHNVLNQLVGILEAMKVQGTAGVYLSPDTLAKLKDALNKRASAVKSKEAAETAAVHSVIREEAAHSQKAPFYQEEDAEYKKELPPTTYTPMLVSLEDEKALLTNEVNSLAEAADSDNEVKTVAIQLPENPGVKLPEGSKQERWNFLRNHVLSCPECNRHVQPGKKVVFGVGNLGADIFFCGDAPDADEETSGEPFVGKDGQLLSKIIQAMGLSREKVYLANIVNWRPDTANPFENRPPTQEEMNFCLPYLKAQLEIIQPKVLVALGASAVNGLLGFDKKRKLSDVRGEWTLFNNIPLMITFHPSYLLRNNTNRTKRVVWEDMLKVMERISLPISEKQRGFFQD